MSSWRAGAEGATPTNAMIRQKSHTSEVRAEQAASKTYQTIKLGLDVHAESIVVVRIVDHSAPQPAKKFTPAKFLDWVKTQMAQTQAVHSCYEAGPLGYGLHRALVALGVQNLVTQPVCLDERRKGVNHEKSDARELALRLDRYAAVDDQRRDVEPLQVFGEVRLGDALMQSYPLLCPHIMPCIHPRCSLWEGTARPSWERVMTLAHSCAFQSFEQCLKVGNQIDQRRPASGENVIGVRQRIAQ